MGWDGTIHCSPRLSVSTGRVHRWNVSLVLREESLKRNQIISVKPHMGGMLRLLPKWTTCNHLKHSSLLKLHFTQLQIYITPDMLCRRHESFVSSPTRQHIIRWSACSAPCTRLSDDPCCHRPPSPGGLCTKCQCKYSYMSLTLSDCLFHHAFSLLFFTFDCSCLSFWKQNTKLNGLSCNFSWNKHTLGHETHIMNMKITPLT